MDQLNVAIKVGSSVLTLVLGLLTYVSAQFWKNKKIMDQKICESEARTNVLCDKLDDKYEKLDKEKADKEMLEVNLKYLNQANEEQTVLINTIGSNVNNLNEKVNLISNDLAGAIATIKNISIQNKNIYKYIAKKNEAKT